MRFHPVSAEEAEEESGRFEPWPKGIYDFEVVEASEEVSKAGNDMIKLRLKVFKPTGAETTVFDYLMEAISYKLRHAAEACGQVDKYERGELYADDFLGRTGRLKLGVEAAKNGYAARNRVDDYIPGAQPVSKSGPRVPRNVGQEIDDEIPF